MKLKLILVLFPFIFVKSYGQPGDSITICFHLVYGEHSLVLQTEPNPLNPIDSIQFETLKFYISNIQLLFSGNVVYTESGSFHLIDAADAKSLKISLHPDSKISYNEIHFNLGIDSNTNVSGAQGGDLDPTKGMYWTWQSGYINFKLEGTSVVCPTLKNKFEFHLGGYQAPFKTLQAIRLKIHSKGVKDIYLDLKKYFDAIDLKKQNQVMSPNQQAVELSAILTKCFYTR